MKNFLILILLFTHSLSASLNETIKIVYNSGTPPLKFTDKNKQANGMLIDIWKLWAKRTGQKIEFIEASWVDTLLMVKDGRADIHGGLYYTKDRDEYLDYSSKPLYENKSYFFYHKSITKIKNNKDIFPFVVGVGNGYPRQFMMENYPEVLIRKYTSDKLAIDAVKEGKIRVSLNSLATFTYSLKMNRLDVDSFQYIEEKPAFIKKYFGAVQSGNKELLKIINDGFMKISSQELKDIELKWTKDLDVSQFSSKINNSQFNKKELDFIHKNKTIKIVANPSWPPFSFINSKTNKPDGIAADYIRLIAKETGISFEYVKTSSWDESIKKIQKKEIDIFGIIKQTPQRDKYLNFTDTYITFPMVAVTKSDISFVSSIDDIKNKKFAMIKNFSSTEYLKTNYPNLNVTLYLNAKECMDAVSKNKANIFIGSLGTVSYLLKEYAYVNLKIAGKIGIASSWGIGVRNNMEPELISIFNKALKHISQKQKNDILNKWITIEFDGQVDYTIIYQIIGLFIFFMMGTLYWNRKLSLAKKAVVASEIKTRSIIENSQDALIVIDNNSNIVMWNNAATTIFGFKYNDIIGKSIEIIIPDKFKELHFAGIDRVINGGEKKLIGKGAIEIEGLHQNGTRIPIDLALNSYRIDKKIFFSANIRDISERKILTIALEEEKLFIDSVVNSQDNFVITSDGRYLKTANKAFLKFYNINNVDEFIDQFGDCICDTFDVTAEAKYIQKMINDEQWIDYIYNRPNDIHKTIIIKDNKKYIFTITADKFIFKGKELKVSVFTDVTQMEKITQEIEHINKHTRDSIEYASLIQGALIPEKNILNSYFKDSFVFWEPKDVVGGDIYLFEELRDKDESLLMIIDCTGHGVPGALVTMLVKAIERQIISKIKNDRYYDIDVSPAWIFGYFNRMTKSLLKQNSPDSLSNAGFDGGIIYYNRKTQILKFSGTETALYYIDSDNKLNTVKGNRYSVGYKKCAIDYKYKETIIKVKEGMKFYCTTDGFIDQNGGEKDFPFGKRRFKELIENNHTKPMGEQKEILLSALKDYESKVENNERNDDITIVSFEIPSRSTIQIRKVEIIRYDGVITQNIIALSMDNIESKILDKKMIGTISTIVIELCQNMKRYAKIKDNNLTNTISEGFICVKQINNKEYEINSRNIISHKDKIILENTLSHIQNLDKESVSKYYRELRKDINSQDIDAKGIGLYGIAKLSKTIEFEFLKISEESFNFNFKSIVKSD